MSTYYWNGGAYLWTTPNIFFGPEILTGPDAGTYPRYPGPPGPGDVVFLSNAPTLDNVAIVGETIEIQVTLSEVADTIQDSSFDATTTIDVNGNGFWSNDDFGTLSTSAIMNIGNAGTFGEASFLLAQTTGSTPTPSISNGGVINIVNGYIIMNDAGPVGDEIDGQFLNLDVINIQNAGSSASLLFDNLTSGTNGFVNDGTIAINGEGAASDILARGFFAGAISGAGNINITDGELSVLQGVSSGQSITFQDSNGILILGTDDLSGDTFQASIEGFRPGDTIDLGTAASSIDPSEVGVIRVLEGVDEVGSLDLTAAFGSNVFALGQNTTNGDGLLEMVAPCYAAGTRILTGTGEVAVQHLRAGDRVVTMHGRRLAPVRWIGHRRIDLRGHGRPWDVDPIRVRAHAFGADRPHTDLLLSPDHAVFVDQVLIPVRHLLNGATVVQEHLDGIITYYHVELADHDVLLAEGLPAESYLDTGNRGAFGNGDPAVRMQPDFALKVWEAKACAPLAWDGARLQAARSLLRERAALLGHATTRDPDLRLIADGRELRPENHGRTHRFHVPACACGVRLVSRRAVPAQLWDDSTDHRRLGVAVSRVVHNGAVIPLADARLDFGWHDLEHGEGGAVWRWTDGDAGLAVPGGHSLDIEVAITGNYWVERKAIQTRVA
jgi:hypothetical protein